MGSQERNADTQSVPLPSKNSSSAPVRYASTHQSQEEWEEVEGPPDGGNSGARQDLAKVEKQEGYLLKKRKWPLKGWHKRFFVLDEGILRYAKTPLDITKGKLHGCIDVRLSVMTVNKKTKRIELDTEESLYHLKAKSEEFFNTWVAKLCYHRLFRKSEGLKLSRALLSETDDCQSVSAGITEKNVAVDGMSPSMVSENAQKNFLLMDVSEEMDSCSKDLSECHQNLTELSKLLQSLEILHRVHSAPVICSSQISVAEKTKKVKRTSKIWCTQNFAKDDTIGSRASRLHASVPNLPGCLDLTPAPTAFNLPAEYAQLQQYFCNLAQKVHCSLSSAFTAITAERERLKRTWQDLETKQTPTSQLLTYRGSFSEVTGENAHLPNCLQRIHSLSASSDTTVDSFVSVTQEEQVSPCVDGQALLHKQVNRSTLSLSDSYTEFFDACDVILTSSSSENEASDSESCVSETASSTWDMNMEAVMGAAHLSKGTNSLAYVSLNDVTRRSCLPMPGPNTSHISLWNILRNNIGKDLSKVSMPVQLNEPLNTLQRFCEELEYSALLDLANHAEDPFDRMVYVAAFAVSSYASTYYRAGAKPFNPVLGETYECERADKGFTFISEQVSHHPPVSVCHAESENFVFWQDVRWKNKFWGKSLEIVPVGTINLTLPSFGDHYEWNKVTSCIHNILSGQRWIEHYGEVIIRNLQSPICHCKITFCKARYWSSTVNDIQGAVLDESGSVIHRIFGKWHEGVYWGTPPNTKCIWKPNSMPKDQEKYYGFTKFALELNELTPDLKPLLPPTDTRLRPDQRFLEEGNVTGAEIQKQRIEQLQRDRRKVMEENTLLHQPRFFRKSVDSSGKEFWVSNGSYWKLRKDPGFAKLDNPVLW
ncbi:oxysterol-binding protein-related protein 7 [Protopterus annectens]|uniref:oxysterol-binding protein-related protein 7 n=1 Tax=Protopterus annectens TaxID=7888 RepID=UPI001CFAA776|nr:oxysterol-binding protein-related protein 7 [Protopterus annectens]